MLVHRFSAMADYAKFLQGHPEEVEQLSEDVLITVTRFFRDAPSLQALVKKVFPALLNRRPRGRPVRIWIPGCSSGEEVYSLAMLLAEQLGNAVGHLSQQHRAGCFAGAPAALLHANGGRLPHREGDPRPVRLRAAGHGGGPALLAA
jgi:hypothetical protein